jgi:thiol-disulfide isomerase/thioredoxin
MFRNACATAVLLLLALISSPVHAETFQDHYIALDRPQPMPDLVFEDAHGQMRSLADFRGRPVLLNLWASWCGPCVEEMPSLDHLQAELGAKNLAVIALNEDRHDADTIAVFYKRYGIKNLEIHNDPTGRALSALHIRGLPTTLLIRADGSEIGYMEGGTNWSAPATVAFIKSQLLNK